MKINKFTFLLAFIVLAAFTLEKAIPALNLNGMNKSANPADDFYDYANGTWLKNNPVPESESRWGSFNEIVEQNNVLLSQILQEAAKNKTAKPSSAIDKVGKFYRVFMDTSKRETQGISPVLPYLKQIDAISSKEQLIQTIAKFHKIGIRCLFGSYVSQDIKNSSKYIVYMGQGGIGLPDRDYYLKNDPKTLKIKKAYFDYISNAFKIFGVGNIIDTTNSHIESVIGIETELASSSMSRVERRDTEKQYNKFKKEEVFGKYSNMLISNYYAAIPELKFSDVIVSQPLFFDKVCQLTDKYNMEQWKLYLKWCFINSSMSYLNSECEKLRFDFYSTTLSGVKTQKPTWKRAIDATNATVGELLGQLFVEKAFSQNSKQRVNVILDNISEAFKGRLQKLDWMSGETKVKALEKLAGFTRKLGYPDKWKDYSKLNITEGSYFENHINENIFSYNEMIDKMGKAVDRTEWGMLPQTVNAYYNPQNNEIVFPAAIMQPPFFNAYADEAVNYGSIGAVIGHEFLHGFDDQGSKYGPDGNLKSWWTEEDRKKFEVKTKMLVNQFNSYIVIDSLHVNGELTLGENIADLGGLTMAYEALKMYLKNNPSANKIIDGYTPEQRFFIGFAQVWKNNSRPEAARQLILTDPHSPPQFRVFGTLSNMNQFYEIWGVKEGNTMYRKPEERATIW
ncbi:MAG: M13 family peptidase [Bacteroidetes bacterium]|nr:M13 family peptidase [Bacteroidota bacterium]